ncbi:MAG: hypothetical protein LBI60_01895 [Bacteroidales bacterium]|jgi:hypothetical protein|nr:hypothetical protein [Bacteroidales bacterium]
MKDIGFLKFMNSLMSCRVLFLSAIALIVLSCGSRKNSCDYPYIYDTITGRKTYTLVNDMPIFPNGELDFYNYLSENFDWESDVDTQQSFNLRFVIDKNGNLLGARIFGKQKDEYGENEKEIIETFKKSPKWIPGKCCGKKVDVFMKMKIYMKFKQ